MAVFPRPKYLSTLAALLVAGSQMDAAVLLSTDFTGRTVSGKTASNITWTENGLSAPTSLTAVDEVPLDATNFTSLFDTASAQGHFAPDKNIGNEGPWSVTATLGLTTSFITLESIDIDWQHFDNNGNIQGANRNVRWTVTVTGSSSGLMGTVVGAAFGTSGLETLTFITPISLNDSEVYDVKFYVDNNGNSTGNNTGFDALTFNGAIIPEPSSTLLFGLGGLVLLRRRR